MNNWIVEIDTNTRDDVMKVCAILANGIGKDTPSKRRVQSWILGAAHGGKSAIVDGLTAAFVDGMKPYRLPFKPLVEDYPGHAFDNVKKEFDINGVPCTTTFGRNRYVIKDDLWNKIKRPFVKATERRGLDFITGYGGARDPGDIKIKLERRNHPRFGNEDTWERSWTIEILDRGLQTPQMAEALQNLRNFHDRRQARLQSREALMEIEP